MILDDLLHILRQKGDSFISGEELSGSLGVSRTALRKAIRQLNEQGCRIESVPRRGYRLSSESDVLRADVIARYLRHKELDLRVYRTIGSTNSVLKALAADGAPANLALVAEHQTAGRGRMGRSFYSPSGTGLYLSLLLRPAAPAAKAMYITACAAVAASLAIEELAGRSTRIKWVNDILIGQKKVCGILTEAGIDADNGMLRYAVIGLGINVLEPDGGFPPEIAGIAGAILERDRDPVPDIRCRLAAGVLDRLCEYTGAPDDPAVFEAYRERSFLLGRDISILRPGVKPVPAHVLDLNRDYSLHVRLCDGSLADISSGEVSVRATQEPESIE
ncbi:MAG: biotin--[acetyl-CoA-carboxylase] ligase [Oscillospiraceae bacterium]|nr:biotin--[acetyl-CoA-carboxylase] ligase [Oscillospiraceae bacterium]